LQIIRNCSEREDVASCIQGRICPGLLGGEVVRRSHHLAGLCDPAFLLVCLLGQPEVEQFRFEVRADQDISRLQVPMHDLIAMEEVHR
jgi:hypothetical protein